MTGTEINAMTAALLLALGVVAPLPAFGGGMLIALGCSYGIRALRHDDGQRGVGMTLFIGALVALMTAILHPATHNIWIWGSLPVQAQMGIAGALSQSVAEAVIIFGRGLADKVGKVPGSIRLPGEGDGQ